MTTGRPLEDTAAARMLREGLNRLNEEENVSIRRLAPQLGYKSGVVLSHMAAGRAPIPVDRARDLAEALDLDQVSFLQAVLEQRYPEIRWRHIFKDREEKGGGDLISAIRLISDVPLEDLNSEQKRVMREVAADPRPLRRWLSIHEIESAQILRELRPGIVENGLSSTDRSTIRAALSRSTSAEYPD